jgi:hypothetical protein
MVLPLQSYFDSACSAKVERAGNRKVSRNIDDILFIIPSFGNSDCGVSPFGGIGYIECFWRWRIVSCVIGARKKTETKNKG